MPKRFTDTEKWKDEWWGSLDNDYRMIWLYLIDSCSIAGIWKKDFRGLNFNCNVQITEDKFLEVFGSRLIDRGNYYFIPKFLRFQCPKGLNSNKPAIISIVKEIEQNNLISIMHESLGNDFLIIKGKGKGTDKGKGEGKGEGKDNDQNYVTVANEIVNHVKVIEYYEAQLNGTQKEYGLPAWNQLINSWFLENLQQNFQDNDHLKNSFKKWYINRKPKTYQKERVKLL
jgi:hypothetical protein